MKFVNKNIANKTMKRVILEVGVEEAEEGIARGNFSNKNMLKIKLIKTPKEIMNIQDINFITKVMVKINKCIKTIFIIIDTSININAIIIQDLILNHRPHQNQEVPHKIIHPNFNQNKKTFNQILKT